MSLRLLAAIAVVMLAVPAHAQQNVRLEFSGGRVSLSVQNAQVRAVLAEWARLSGTTIVNGDRLVGPPVTLELNNVTERQALDTLLRSVAGYVLAPRRPGTTGVSAFDRIMILPTSVGPVNPVGPAPAAAGVPRPIAVPRPLVGAAQPEEAPADNPADDGPAPAPAVRVGQPVVAPRPLIPAPAPTQQPDSADDQDEPAERQTQPAGPATPGNPFGIPAGSTATPGFVTPAPRPQPAPNTPQGR